MDASKSNGGPILVVVPSLGPNGTAKQVSLLAPAIARSGKSIHIAVLGPGDMFADTLRAAGIPVHLLGPKWPFPKLWNLIGELKPGSIHAWRGAALRQVFGLGLFRKLPPVIAVNPFAERSSNWLSRQMSRRAGAIVVHGEWERRRTMQTGIGEERLHVIPMCVAETPVPERNAALRDLGIPDNASLIVCAGAMEQERGFREAAWVMDILSYVYPDLWLLLIGDGSQRRWIEGFASHGANVDTRLCFAGWRRDAAAILGLAEVVWVLGKRGGRNVALEALAAGRPVVARDRPDLREILVDGETGFLVDRADPHETARATRRILDDQTRRQAFEANARRRAEQFSVAAAAAQWASLLDLPVNPLHRGPNRLT